MKRLITKLLILSMLITALIGGVVSPESFAASTATISKDDKAVLYTPDSDYRSGDCILSSSKTMIRRAAIMRGSKLWSQTTNKAIRKDATIFGLLLHNFTHSTDGLAYTIRCGFFKGKTEADRIKEFEKLIKEHPEGVVVWGKKASIFGQHGVLLTGVKDGVVYAADSYYNKGKRSLGIQQWKDTSMYSPLRCTQYWYIKQVTIAKGAKAPAAGKALKPTSADTTNVASTLRISDATKPVSVNQGYGYPVAGVIESNYRIRKVTVSITNSKGKAVITQSAAPNTWIYDLNGLDAKVRFGTLAAGSYRYRVTAGDEKKTATLVDGAFNVIAPKKPTSTLAIKSYNAPTRNRRGYSYSIHGTITSNKKISKVTVQVLDSKGKVRLSAKANPKSKSYNVKKLDYDIRFGTLPLGSYTYRITATDAVQTKTLVNKAFTVVKP